MMVVPKQPCLLLELVDFFLQFKFNAGLTSIHREGKVPVLDLQVYVNQQGTIAHKFYENPVSCKLVILASSVHSRKTKIAVMVEEGVRRNGVTGI